MGFSMKKFLLLAGLMSGSFTVNAMPDTGQLNYNLVNFSTQVSRQVENDEVNATLSKILQNKSHTELAKRITETLNQANLIAKKYPTVKVATGNQATYPQYDKNSKINGWQSSANLNLQSNDTVAMSQLIAELQNFMQLENLGFSVSDNKQKSVKQALMLEASKRFQQQANELLPAWNAKGYELVRLDFNGGDGFSVYRKSIRVSPMMAVAEASSIPSQDFQTGDSTITVTANGVIQLLK